MKKGKIIFISVVLSVFVALVYMFMPTSHPASDRALDQSCKNNLKLIHQALQYYIAENGALPSKENIQNSLYLSNPSVFRCPIKRRYNSSATENEVDYLFEYDVNDWKETSKVWVMDKSDNHSLAKDKLIQNSVNYLSGDGIVRERNLK